MSADKEVYVESSISLEGKYPQFAMEGDDKSDIVVRFSQCDNAKVVLSEEAEEDIGGPLEMHMTSDGEKLAAVRFPGAVKRWKLERISVRYEEDRDLVYVRFRWFLRQELSLEVEELDEDLVIDLDKKDRVIGLAVLNASKHLDASTLKNLASGSEWIKLLVISSEFESLEAVRAAKKAKKKAKKLVATQTARVVATPSPSPHVADSNPSFGECVPPQTAPKVVHNQAPKRRRVYTGAKVNLIPQDGIAAATNLGDESQRTYFSNRFVRDLEWVLNFPFILSEPNQLLASSGSIPPPASSSPSTSTTEAAVDNKDLPLVPSAWCDLGKPTQQFLAELDANPELYLPWIRERLSRSNNLGGYFTLLLEFLLGRSQNVAKVCPKYQMFAGDKRTVGDFDFLLQLKDDKTLDDEQHTGEAVEKTHWVHWEVGIKFYLLLNTESPETGFPSFVGPHCTGDSLEKYVTKTVKQLELRHVEQVVSQLTAEGKMPVDSRFFLKGYVFFPLTPQYYQMEQQTSSIPFYSGNSADGFPVDYWAESSGWLYDKNALRTGGLNGGPVAGWWAQYPHVFPYNENGDAGADMSEDNLEMIRKDETLDFDILYLDAAPTTLEKQEKLQHSMWTVLNKMDYMAPLLVTPERPDVHLFGYHALKRAVKMCFATNYRSLFVAEVVPYSRSQFRDCPNPLHVTHVEVSRGFIVGQHWPHAPKDVDLSDSR